MVLHSDQTRHYFPRSLAKLLEIVQTSWNTVPHLVGLPMYNISSYWLTISDFGTSRTSSSEPLSLQIALLGEGTADHPPCLKTIVSQVPIAARLVLVRNWNQKSPLLCLKNFYVLSTITS